MSNYRWKFFGIVSFTVSTSCDESRHIVYTDVTKYLSWINQFTGIYSYKLIVESTTKVPASRTSVSTTESSVSKNSSETNSETAFTSLTDAEQNAEPGSVL